MEPRFSVRHGEQMMTVCGELDLAGVALFRAAVAEHDDQQVEVDLRELTFVDSTGLRALLEARQANPGLRHVNPSPQLRRLAELTGTAALLFDHVA